MGTKLSMKPSAVLRRARLLLERKGWTRGAFARKRGSEIFVEYDDPRADCFCASGAIAVVSDGVSGAVYSKSLKVLAAKVAPGNPLPFRGVENWNDAQPASPAGKRRVLAAFKEAEAAARAAGE